jgi:hypothetical protein
MVWFHAVKSKCDNVMVYSLDTDVYHIGLCCAANVPSKNLYVQIHSGCNANLYINVNNLLQNIKERVQFNTTDDKEMASIIIMLFICTGCDYVSFFKHHGKNSFFDSFFKNMDFIMCNKVTPCHRFMDHCSGSIGDHLNMESSFQSFLRLIGCEYFRLCKRFFDQTYKVSSELFMSLFQPSMSQDVTWKR